MEDLKNKFTILLIFLILSIVLLIVFLVCKIYYIGLFFVFVPIILLAYTIDTYKKIKVIEDNIEYEKNMKKLSKIIMSQNKEKEEKNTCLQLSNKTITEQPMKIKSFTQIIDEIIDERNKELTRTDNTSKLLLIDHLLDTCESIALELDFAFGKDTFFKDKFTNYKQKIEIEISRLVNQSLKAFKGHTVINPQDDDVVDYLIRHANAINLYYLLDLNTYFENYFDNVIEIIIKLLENDKLMDKLKNFNQYEYFQSEFIKTIKDEL